MKAIEELKQYIEASRDHGLKYDPSAITICYELSLKELINKALKEREQEAFEAGEWKQHVLNSAEYMDNPKFDDLHIWQSKQKYL